jgi:hypothetical protein
VVSVSDELGDSFVETIQKSQLSDLAIDAADALVSPLPIFGKLRKLLNGIQSVHAYYYAKKVLAFLTEIEQIPQRARQEQISAMAVVPGEREKFGEHVALLLDRMNEIEKAKLMGRVVTAFLKKEITLDDMKSLNFALDAIDLRVISTLKSACNGERTREGEDHHLLAQCGLMTPDVYVHTDPLELAFANLDGGNEPPQTYHTFREAGMYHKVNRLGRLLVKVCSG